MNKIKLLTFLKWTHIILFVLIIIFVIVFNFLPKPEDNIFVSPSSILKEDSLRINSDNTEAHNSAILNILQSRESTIDSFNASREESIRQARNIYFGVLAILLSLLFGKSLNGKYQPYYLILSFIMILYMLDVHIEDLLKRESAYGQITHRAVEKLANSTSLNEIWYDLNYEKSLAQLVDASAWEKRWYRKLYTACQYHPERFVYYCIPWLVIYFITWRKILVTA